MDENDKKVIDQLTKDYTGAMEQLKALPGMEQQIKDLGKSLEETTKQIKENAERKGAMVECITGDRDEDRRLSVGSLVKSVVAHAMAESRHPDPELGRLRLNDENSCRKFGYTGLEKELGEHLLTKSGTYGLASLDDAGGVFIPHDLMGEYIKKLRPSERVIFDAGAGLTDLPAGAGVLTIPVQKALASATGVDEVGQLVQTGLDWGIKQVTPHRIGNASLISRRLLFSASKYEQILVNEILYAVWREVQRQIFYGKGALSEVSGLDKDAGLTKLYAGNAYSTSVGSSNGKILTYLDANAMEDKLAQANGRTEGFAMVTRSEVIRNMKNSIINSNANFNLTPESTLASDKNLREALGIDRTFHRLTDISNGLTVGSSTDCAHVWFGQFDNVEVFTWGGIQVKASAEAVVGGKSAFERNSLALAADLNWDVLFKQTAELFRIEDARAAYATGA